MSEFRETHVDYQRNVTFTANQIARRWDAELQRYWSMQTQDNLRDFMQIKDDVDPQTFPNYQANLALLNAFIADKTICYTRRLQDEVRNARLKAAIAYEEAYAQIPILSVGLAGGQEYVAPTLNEAGEVVDPGQPKIEAIHPFILDGEGNPTDIPNSLYQTANEKLVEYEAVVLSASQEVLEVVAERAGE